jgi:peroxiredoxin
MGEVAGAAGPREIGDRAPRFEIPGPDGRLVAPADSGALTVLAFYKASCPTCRLTFPWLERIHRRFAGRPGIRFLGVAQDPRPEIDAFASEHGVTFPILDDAPEYRASRAFGVTTVPTTFVIEPDGIISFTAVGFAKTDLESIARGLALRTGEDPEPLFHPGDGVPALRPG